MRAPRAKFTPETSKDWLDHEPFGPSHRFSAERFGIRTILGLSTLVLLLVGLIIVAFVGMPYAGAQDTDADLAEQLTNDETLVDNRASQQELTAKQGGIANQINELDDDLAVLEHRLADLETAMADQEELLAHLATEQGVLADEQAYLRAQADEAEVLIERLSDELAERVIAAYMLPRTDANAEFVASKDITEAETKRVLIDAVAEHEVRGIDEIKAEEARLDRTREQVELIAEQVAKREAQERATAASFLANKAQFEAIRAELAARIASFEAEAAALAAAEVEVRRIIQEREDQLRAEAEERARLQAICEAQAAGEIQTDADAAAAGCPNPPPVGPNDLVRPVTGAITSFFGMRNDAMHQGMDFAGNNGDPIVAAASGEVYFAGWIEGYGNTVLIDHGGGIHTLYAHQSVMDVMDGAIVERGQTIGRVGSTGRSTGPHLHFEVQVDGHAVDPVGYIVG